MQLRMVPIVRYVIYLTNLEFRPFVHLTEIPIAKQAGLKDAFAFHRLSFTHPSTHKKLFVFILGLL
jgi:hypothetical protein